MELKSLTTNMGQRHYYSHLRLSIHLDIFSEAKRHVVPLAKLHHSASRVGASCRRGNRMISNEQILQMCNHYSLCAKIKT